MLQTEVKEQLGKNLKKKTEELKSYASVKSLATEHHALVRLNVAMYKAAYLVELDYVDDCVADKNYHKEFPRFDVFMEKHIPLFDVKEYLAYKPLILLKREDLLDKLDNAAFRELREKLVFLSTGAVHVKTIDVFNDLPINKKVITDIDVINVLNKHGIKQKRLAQAKGYVIPKKGFTDAQFKKMTKNDVIALCKKFQKKMFSLEAKLKAKH